MSLRLGRARSGRTAPPRLRFTLLGDGCDDRTVIVSGHSHVAEIKSQFFCGLVLDFSAVAQTLNFSNGVQTYVTLSNTTVTMTGRCELRVTAASNPIPGCTINLNSSNAWLLLTGIKPSVVAASYLGQIFVNGAGAVADSNVRVVQYGGAGTVVIPQPPTFQPMQVLGLLNRY